MRIPLWPRHGIYLCGEFDFHREERVELTYKTIERLAENGGPVSGIAVANAMRKHSDLYPSVSGIWIKSDIASLVVSRRIRKISQPDDIFYEVIR